MRNRFLRLLEGAAPGLVLGVVLFIALVGMVPPTSVPADGDPSDFSAERALAHIEVIAADVRPIGSPGNAAARAYVASVLEGMGLEVGTAEQIVPSYYSDEMVPVVNTWAVIPGTDPTGGIALVAHIDTYPGTPGANDNAAAVATVLEAGRAILAGPALRNDVVLLITDGEEPSQRWGSTQFATAADGIGMVINFEAIGSAGPSIVTEVAGDEMEIIGLFADADPRPIGNSVLDEFAELIGGSNTDIAPFRERGVPGIEFAYFQNSPIYHLPADDIDTLNAGSLQHHGGHALGLARAFGEVDLAELAAHTDAIFFSIAGRAVVVYAPWLGVLAAVVLLGMVLTVLWLEVRAGRATWREMVAHAGWHALVALSIGVGLAVLWRALVTVLWSDSGPVGVTAFVWWIVVGVVTIAPTLWWRKRLLRSRDPVGFEWAGLLYWSILAVTFAWVLPGIGYLFTWPALVATVVLVASSAHVSSPSGGGGATAGGDGGGTSRGGSLSWLALVALPAIVLVLPVLDIFFLFAQPRPGNLDSQIPEIILLFGWIGSLATLLLIPWWERAHHRGVSR